MSGTNGSNSNASSSVSSDLKVDQGDTAVVGSEKGQTTGGLLWLRRWSLTIGNASGDNAIDLSWLYFTFSVKQQQISSPWSATITVYNVGNNLLGEAQKEYTNVRLEAGYWSGQYGVLFQGPIVYYRSGRKDATDTFIEIYAVVQDQVFSQAMINTHLPAGHTKDDIVNACIVQSLQKYGVQRGQITQLSPQQATRGRALFGMTASILRDLARSENAQWFVDQDGRLHLMKQDEALSDTDSAVPFINSKSGMIGVPEQTLGGGVNVKCLLNAAIRPGKKIRLNEKDITTYNPINPDAALNPSLSQQLTTGQQNLNADGFYTVGAVEHSGESRGNTWYTSITTVAFNQPQSQVGQPSPAGPGH